MRGASMRTGAERADVSAEALKRAENAERGRIALHA